MSDSSIIQIPIVFCKNCFFTVFRASSATSEEGHDENDTPDDDEDHRRVQIWASCKNKKKLGLSKMVETCPALQNTCCG